MQSIRLGAEGWYAEVHRALEKNEPVDLRVDGWRAKILKSQMPKLAAASEAARLGQRLRETENFSIWYTIVLLRFHELVFFALAHGYSISWSEANSSVLVSFTKMATS